MDNQPQEKSQKSNSFKKIALTAATAVASVAGFVGWDRYTGEKTQTVNVQGIEVVPSDIDLRGTGIPIVIQSPFPSQTVVVGDKGERFSSNSAAIDVPAGVSLRVSNEGIEFTPAVPKEITTRGHGWTQLPTVKEMKPVEAASR